MQICIDVYCLLLDILTFVFIHPYAHPPLNAHVCPTVYFRIKIDNIPVHLCIYQQHNNKFYRQMNSQFAGHVSHCRLLGDLTKGLQRIALERRAVSHCLSSLS